MSLLFPVFSFLFQWCGFQNTVAPLCVPQSCPASLNSHFWWLCPFLSSLLKFTCIQKPVNGMFIQIGQCLTHFLPSSSYRLTFAVLYFHQRWIPPPWYWHKRREVFLLAPSTECYKSNAWISHSRRLSDPGTAMSELSCIFIGHLASDL